MFDSIRREAVPERLGRYEVIDLIGQGGQGSVYKVRNPTLGRVEALKIQRGPAVEEEVRRFEREAQVLGRVRHPNILPVYEVGQVEGRPFYTAEFVDGENLAELVHRRGPLPAPEALRIGRDLARALAAAHAQNVTHRDVKPHNVLIDGERILLTDFGLARAHDEASLTQVTGAIMGTLAYMAPEQAQGQREKVTARSDVYGLGATLYHLLAGRPPYDGGATMGLLRDVIFRDPTPLTRATPGVPAEAVAIVEKCMEKEPMRRYASAADAADDMDRYLRGEVILARRASIVTRVVKHARRNPLAWALGASILAGALLGVVQLARQARAQEVLARVERGRGRVERARAASYMKDCDLKGVWAEFPAARAEFEAALDIDPDNAAAWYWIGRSYREEMNYEKAIEALHRATDLDEAWVELGRAHMEAGLQAVRFLPDAEQGPALDAAAAEADACFAHARALDGLDSEIAQAYRLVIARNYAAFQALVDEVGARYGVVPGVEELDWLMGVASTTPAERVAHFTRAIERRPGYIAALLERGHNLEDPQAKFEDFDRVVALKPDLEHARKNLASARLRLGDAEGVLAELEAWAVDAQGINNLGYAYYLLGRYADAVACYDRIAEPTAPTLFNRGLARTASGDDAGALADFDAALRIDGTHAEAHANRAGVLGRAGRFDEAVEAFSRAIALKPGVAGFWADRGAARSLRRDVEGALADYDEALALDPALTRARYNRGCLRLAARRFAEAVEDLDIVIAAREYLVGAYANRGSARLHLGDVEGARDDFRCALEEAPPDYRDRAKLEAQLKELEGDF